MKQRKKLLWSLACIMFAGLAYRLAIHQSDLLWSNIWIGIAATSFVAALIIFAIYFRE